MDFRRVFLKSLVVEIWCSLQVCTNSAFLHVLVAISLLQLLNVRVRTGGILWPAFGHSWAMSRI